LNYVEYYILECEAVYIFKVVYLTTLSVSRLYSADDRMINERGDKVELELSGETEVHGENHPE
jgi:hypothetical protein